MKEVIKLKKDGSIEFETIKSHKNRLYFLCGFVCVVVLLIIFVVTRSHAKYRVTQSIPLVNGTINYSLADLNIVAITVDGESVDTIPDGNYELTEESYCTINGEKDSSISITYDSNTKTLNVIPFTTKGTKCYLDFVTSTTKKVDTVLGTIEVNLDTPDFSKTAQASCSDTSKCEETNGIYEETTSKGRTYYFRGAVDNNWVKFGGFYWRLIRINEDGSLRIIYSGDGSAQTTGTGTQIGKSAFNSTRTDNMYVGFKYTTNNVHGTGTNSTILNELNEWYQDNLSSYANSIDGNAGFCNDRTPYSGTGLGTNATNYAAYNRLYTNKAPTFECSNSSDLFTTSGSSQGNKALQYPIGLITADEVAYAGGVYGTNNTSYYLYTGQNYWTMSPYAVNGSGHAFVFGVYSNGNLGAPRVYNTYGVRPVINLKSNVQITGGNGTADNPYIVQTD